MKKLLSVLMTLVLVASLFGCGSGSTDAEAVVEAYRSSAQILLDNGDISSAVELLTNAVRETGDASLAAMLEEAITLKAQLEESQPAPQELPSETESTTSVSIEVRVSDVYNDGFSTLPQIELPYDNVKNINQEIYDYYVPAAEAGTGFSYDWFVNGEVLSVVIHGIGDSYEFYTVYNVSISTGNALEKEAVLSAIGLDIAQYNALAKDAFSSYFLECNGAFASEPYFSSKLEGTVSDDNIAASQVFLGENGSLYAIAYVGSFIGADGYDRIIEIHR